jgi:hypothetical protein
MLCVDNHRLAAIVFGLCVVLLASPQWLSESVRAEDQAEKLRAYLSAGEFGPAQRLADELVIPQEGDRWLGSIAKAQSTAGSYHASMHTALGIQDDGIRSNTFGALGGRTAGNGARGGAALADFDTLIELITSTIAPDSWDAVGGPGAVESFPTGVYVDANGIMKRFAPAPELAGVRMSATRIHGNRDVRVSSALRKISLTRLERHVEMRWAMGERPDEAMQSLAGLQRIQNIFFYPETRDIVLAGPAGGWKEYSAGRLVSVDTGTPIVRLEDLVVTLRNAFGEHESGRFGCAITPSRENLASVQQFLADSDGSSPSRTRREDWLDELRTRLGLQEITVHGIDPRSRTARIIVEADYHMKLIGMGLEEGVPGVESYLETIQLGADGQPPELDVLRWWFTLNYHAIHATPARDAFQFKGPGVRVQSENEMLGARGERIHTGTSDALNQRFAHSFTKNYDDLASKYPIYAELRNVFDLAMVAALLRSEDVVGQIDWQMNHFGPDGTYSVQLGTAPRSVGSVINHRLIGRRHLVAGVSGGVAVDASEFIRLNAPTVDEYDLLQPMHAAKATEEIPVTRWWWD